MTVIATHGPTRKHFLPSAELDLQHASLNKRRRQSSVAKCPKPHLVFLDAVHMPLAQFPFEHTIDVYQSTSPDQVAERIKSADIVVSVLVPVRPADLELAPNVRLVAVLANGCAWIDKPYCAARDISVVHVPNASVEAVGEHFLALYFACRRRIPQVNNCVKTTRDWIEHRTLTKPIWNGTPPLSCKEEVLGIIGYGRLGKRIEGLANGLGFARILVAERKGATEVRKGRFAFEEVLKRSTIVLISCPFSDEAINMIDEPQLSLMRQDAILVNIARGGIVSEHALAEALKTGQIYSAALDVLWKEPGGPGTSPLLPDLDAGDDDIPNLIVTGHTAYFAGCTVQEMQRVNRNAICSFVRGSLGSDPQVRSSVVVQGGEVWK